MPTSRVLLPFQFKPLLMFPLRSRRDMGQVLFVSVLIIGLQIAFFPLAIILDAGYSFQVARSILLAGTGAVLPDALDWGLMLRDGLRRSGVWLLFLMPGMVVGVLVIFAGFFYAYQTGITQEQIRWLFALYFIGLSVALLLYLVGAVMANVAAMHMLMSDSFRAAFQFRDWLPILRARFASFEITELIVFLGGILLFLVALGAILPASLVCIGAPFLFVVASVYLRLIATAAIALIYRDAIINRK